jgi:protoporphyrinogen IX oxidase
LRIPPVFLHILVMGSASLPDNQHIMELLGWYQSAKSLHLIGMVSWMAGLFYLVRIMVNHAESLGGDPTTKSVFALQYNKMEWKAWRVIIVPAVVMTWSFGVTMLCIQPSWLEQPWIHVKLFFLLLLTGYTWYCKKHIELLEKGGTKHNHVYYRAMNEVPTVIMVAIIFLAVFKQHINWLYLAIGLILFSALIFSAVKKVAKKG